MYKRVAEESPHGDGSISMLENLLSWWQGKLFVLVLLGFVATDFIITITLSAADATAHVIENPFTPEILKHQIGVTLVLIAMLGAIFLRGFKEVIGLAVVIGADPSIGYVSVSKMSEALDEFAVAGALRGLNGNLEEAVLLGTLAASGLVERVSSSGRYRLGLRIVHLANALLARLDVREVARPHLAALVEQTGETATLSVPGDEHAITVDFVPGSHQIQPVSRLGRPSIAHATSAGKVMLAFSGRELPDGPRLPA